MGVRVKTMELVHKLPKQKRRKVEAIVNRYVSACRRQGFLPDAMERAWIEAIEAVEMEEKNPQMKTEERDEWDLARRYDVYTSPVDLKF